MLNNWYCFVKVGCSFKHIFFSSENVFSLGGVTIFSVNILSLLYKFLDDYVRNRPAIPCKSLTSVLTFFLPLSIMLLDDPIFYFISCKHGVDICRRESENGDLDDILFQRLFHIAS